jgi:hypothetical protein
MKVSVQWCLDNIKKAYRIHYFEGTIEQFKTVLLKAECLEIEYTCDITDELIDSVLKS